MRVEITREEGDASERRVAAAWMDGDGWEA